MSYKIQGNPLTVDTNLTGNTTIENLVVNGTLSGVGVVPSGSIMAYMGNTDPTGWVILDGKTRTNNNSMYNNVVTLGLGTVNAGVYTPPDYRGAFLRGDNKGTASTAITTGYASYSSNLKQSQNHATQVHTHGVSEAAHTHGISDGGHIHGTYASDDSGTSDGTTSQSWRAGTAQDLQSGYNTASSTTGISINSASTNITIQNLVETSTVLVNSYETRPYNFAVNWILKL